MGRGDKKSRKGKISRGSYGVTRKRKSSTASVAPKPKAKKKAAPKAKTAEKKEA